MEAETAEKPVKKKKTTSTPSPATGGAQTHSFATETSRVLHLMIHSLYKNRDIFLRELISNASDACDKVKFLALTTPNILEGDADYAITITIDRPGRRLIVRDNGIGMNHDELVSNLGTIARSGTKEFMERLGKGEASDVELIGQFGVGFYSAFIVADSVEVQTRRAGEAQAWRWTSTGEGEFTIAPMEEALQRGTAVILTLKAGEDVYLDAFRLQHIIKTYSDHIPYPITLEAEPGKEGEVVNSAAALWARQKSEITPEQYTEFYRHVGHTFDEPWMTIHNKNEGAINYTNLLFIPTLRPVDLYHPDRIRRVKLYVKRVFITDQDVDIIPHYLRFLRGIVDCDDLPLNVSRETLQQNVVVDKIQSGLVKRVIGELKKRAQKEPESYQEFWEKMGPILKEGLCEANTPREELLEICRFYSSNGEEAMVSLDEYTGRMKENQPEIYYLGCDSREIGLQSPLLDGFKKRGVEVLLFADTVDDFWVNVANEYKGKKLVSITRSGVDLSWAGDVEASEQEQAAEAVPEESREKLLETLRELYGEAANDVRWATNLADTPAVLAVGERDMDIRMERFLYEQKQLHSRSSKILELNPKHPIVLALSKQVSEGELSDAGKDAAWLLLDQARIIAGESVWDAGAFTRRLTQALTEQVG